MIEKVLLLTSASLFNFFIVSVFINKLLPLFEKHFLDIPNNRSIHISPKPTGGGVIIVISSLISYYLLALIIDKSATFEIPFINEIIKIIILCLPISILGFLDDLYDIKSKYKFAIQTITGILFINFIDTFLLQTNFNFFVFIEYITLLIFITGIINMINFMDGIDGLICGIFSFTFFILSIKKNIIFLTLSFGFLAFLKKNWYPSKIFMGDTGSTFLGAIYAALIISTEDFQEAFSMLFIISPVLIDSITCIFRRILIGQNIFKPHKLHLYQRLVQNGLSHDNVSIIYISGCFLTSIFYISNRFLMEIFSVILVFGIGIYLDKKHAKPFPNKYSKID